MRARPHQDDHLDIAAQLYGLVARARQVADLAEIIGEDALSADELRYLGFSGAFESEFLAQGRGEVRSIDETLDRAWAVASRLPRSELTMVAARCAGGALSRWRCESRRVEPAASGWPLASQRPSTHATCSSRSAPF